MSACRMERRRYTWRRTTITRKSFTCFSSTTLSSPPSPTRSTAY